MSLGLFPQLIAYSADNYTVTESARKIVSAKALPPDIAEELAYMTGRTFTHAAICADLAEGGEGFDEKRYLRAIEKDTSRFAFDVDDSATEKVLSFLGDTLHACGRDSVLIVDEGDEENSALVAERIRRMFDRISGAPAPFAPLIDARFVDYRHNRKETPAPLALSSLGLMGSVIVFLAPISAGDMEMVFFHEAGHVLADSSPAEFWPAPEKGEYKEAGNGEGPPRGKPGEDAESAHKHDIMAYARPHEYLVEHLENGLTTPYSGRSPNENLAEFVSAAYVFPALLGAFSASPAVASRINMMEELGYLSPEVLGILRATSADELIRDWISLTWPAYEQADELPDGDGAPQVLTCSARPGVEPWADFLDYEGWALSYLNKETDENFSLCLYRNDPRFRDFIEFAAQRGLIGEETYRFFNYEEVQGWKCTEAGASIYLSIKRIEGLARELLELF